MACVYPICMIEQDYRYVNILRKIYFTKFILVEILWVFNFTNLFITNM